jgi:hypothetical protein
MSRYPIEMSCAANGKKASFHYCSFTQIGARERQMNRRAVTTMVILSCTAFSAMGQEPFFYPPQGRTEEQQEQDRFECHSWAVEQTDFDPVAAAAQAPEGSSVAESPPQGQQQAGGDSGRPVVGGAVRGAVIAEAAGGDASEGAAAGAVLGVAGGRRARRAAAENQAAAQAAAAEQARAEQAAQARALQEQRAAYDRARSTCFRARGYVVSEG